MKKTLITLVVLIIIVGAVWYVIDSNSSMALVPVAQTAVPSATARYSCDAGKTISASFYDGTSTAPQVAGQPPVLTGSVSLVLSDGRSFSLPQALSADGARYSNVDGSFVFWTKGNGAMVIENDQQTDYTNCAVAPTGGSTTTSTTTVTTTTGGTLPQEYMSEKYDFSISVPQGYTTDESYSYQNLGPGKSINGVKFTIPKSMTTGTNLSSDSYISVESIPSTSAASCSASLFLDSGLATKAKTVTDNGVTYSVATSSDAAAGNRYDETVYALPTTATNACLGVRYYIHYGAFENYPAGSITKFNEQALINQFDQIRRTLTVNG